VALIYQAEIRPTKLELIRSWLPAQPWFRGRTVDNLASLGAYRFDDPAGEVGIETLLVDVAGEVVQVPMTYGGAPLVGAAAWLMGTMEHSVLGRCWVYDACADPIYASALADVVLAGGSQAEEWVEGDDGPTKRAPPVTVEGSGSTDATVTGVGDVADLAVSTVGTASTITAPAWVLEVHRIVDPNGGAADVDFELVGIWAAQARPLRLASARRLQPAAAITRARRRSGARRRRLSLSGRCATEAPSVTARREVGDRRTRSACPVRR